MPFPHAHLEILGYKHIVALAEKRFYADAVRSIEYGALASFFARGCEPARRTESITSRSFDLIVSYLFDPDRIFETNVRRCGVGKIFWRARRNSTASEHAALQLARPLGATRSRPHGSSRRDSILHAEDRNSLAQFPVRQRRADRRIHPGSGSETKNWPIEKWLAARSNGSFSRTARPSLAHRWRRSRSRHNYAMLRAALPEAAVQLRGESSAAAPGRGLGTMLALHRARQRHLAHRGGGRCAMHPAVRADRSGGLGAGERRTFRSSERAAE